MVIEYSEYEIEIHVEVPAIMHKIASMLKSDFKFKYSILTKTNICPWKETYNVNPVLFLLLVQ